MFRARTGRAGWTLALAIACAPDPASAALPLGSFAIALGGYDAIWLGRDPVSGSDDGFCDEFTQGLDAVEHCEFEMFIDGTGKLYGHFDFAAWDDGVRIAMRGPLKGSQRGDNRTGLTRSSFSIKLSGEGDDGGVTLGMKASIKYTGQVAPGGAASGVWDERICVAGAGCRSYRSLAPARTLSQGGWRLELEIADAGGGALDGVARVAFENGGECIYAIQGRYSAKSDTSSLTLRPLTSQCDGTSIQLKGMRAPGGANAALFASICDSTLALAGSVDPGACSWSIFDAGQPASAGKPTSVGTQPLSTTELKYKLFGSTGSASVSPSFFSEPTFGWVTPAS